MRSQAFSISFFVLLIFRIEPTIACPDESSAKVVSVKGSAIVESESGPRKELQNAQLNQYICEDSKVTVMPNSLITLALPGDLYIDLSEKTSILLKKLNLDVTTVIKVYNGFLNFISRKPKEVQIENGITNAMPVGTEFAFNAEADNASVWVYEGKVKVFNPYGSLILNPGKAYARVQKGHAPALQIDIKPEDAVNWALYYPPLMSYPVKIDKIDSGLKIAIEDYRHGRVDLALNRLDKLAQTQQTHYLHQIRAGMRLAVGQTKLAEEDIQWLLKQNTNDAEALALKSVIALTQNRKDEALQLAQQAANANTQSVTAHTALSYAEQGRFDLDKAYQAAITATKLAPHDALVWARQAELELSLGLTDDSEKSAEQAYRLDPKLERTQIIKGFSHLQRMDADEAQSAFSRALELDSTSPLARLGLGLAKIRQGNLEEGRKDIEIAAILDPNNSLIRSYLGKAYYEEKRNTLAEEQFNLAKARDPKDPTPYFYNAIREQTTNRPIEALHDMQKAMELNDNRAVYRSNLMLDSDFAARSASLGRIYNDLGFQQRGLLEGWRSIDKDPTNYSAHRLLADNYAALPRHEISRVSELLKSQLLQPINITPVQPQAAESNLLLLDGLGASIPSFNEYNPMFSRNRFALQTTGFYGSRNTLSDEVVHSGIWNKFSYSLGQFHYQTDGFRKNNRQNKDIYNFFAQAQIAQDTSAQFEFRKNIIGTGDISQNFNKDDFDSSKKFNTDSESYRLGLHHAFTPNSDLLMSIVHKDNNSNVFNQYFSYLDMLGGTQFELQHIYKKKDFDLSLGANHLAAPPETLILNFFGSNNLNLKQLNHSAIYAYSTVKSLPHLSLTIGLSQDFFSSVSNSNIGNNSQNPLNPKFGLIWQPSPNTTIRFAAFQSLQRGIIQNQTLEPTQVAGFNQFYDGDIQGSISQRIGFGIDHKLTNLYLGSEISHRHIRYHNQDISLLSDELNARAYLNWIPDDYHTFGLNYNFDQNKNEGNRFISPFKKIDSHSLQLFGNYFHPAGFIAKLKLSYNNQTGSFSGNSRNNFQNGHTQFWLLDTELGYRLPKRYGIVSVGIRNLLDEHYNYQAIDQNQPELPQGRFLYGRVTFSF